jgi:hypothetical protein
MRINSRKSERSSKTAANNSGANLSMMTCSRSKGASNEVRGQIGRRHELTFSPTLGQHKGRTFQHDKHNANYR